MSNLDLEVDAANTKILQVLDGHALAGLPKASELLDCGLSRIYSLIDAGELRSFLVGGRRKIAISDIVDFIEKKRAEPPKKRVAPWDRFGVSPRQRHPRRGAADVEPAATPVKAPAPKREVKRSAGR